MIYDAIRTGIAFGFKCMGFLMVMAMVYCFARALGCFSDWIVIKTIGEDEEDDAPMDD